MRLNSYRFFEILPGAAVWFVLLFLFLLSQREPTAVAIFIMLYDLYWFLKIVYLLFPLRYSFLKMKENLKTNWLLKLKQEEGSRWEDVYHLVIFPMYHESYNLVRQSFLALLQTNYPKDKFLVVLAIEERGGRADRETALKIEDEFGDSFRLFLKTVHPASIPGELAGKGSNETWAAREASRAIAEKLKIPDENILVSVFDIDTRAGEDYFAILAYKFLKSERRNRSSFQPIPLFINNIRQAPILARITAFSATFWQFMQQARSEKLVTFSSHSMPLSALKEVGFWETDLVSEDSRIFFQCLNRYNGDWRAEPLFYPVYMDAVSGKGFFDSLKNLYKQQRRWAWGVENIPRFLNDVVKNGLFPLRKKIFWFLTSFSGYFSWASSSFIIFLFGWLPIFVGGHRFRETVISYSLPKITGILLNLSLIGVIVSAFLSVVLMAPRLRGLRRRDYVLYVLQWFLMPIVMVFFSSLPAIEAQTRLMLGGRFRLGFWKTPKP